jgi:tetratricopeptide (TPR) repeat protein
MGFFEFIATKRRAQMVSITNLGQSARSPLAQAQHLLRAGRTDQAIAVLRTITTAARQIDQAHVLLIEALVNDGQRADAIAAFEQFARDCPLTADSANALAFLARRLDLHGASYRFYREASARAPDNPEYWYNVATSERAWGQLEAAADACNRCIALAPDMGAALLLRSELVRATPTANNLTDLRRRIARMSGINSEVVLQFALGKELHDLSDYDAAFKAFARGASLRRRSLQYDVAVDEAKMQRIIEVFDEPGIPADAPAGTSRHIFVIGLPRSGTTLTERILGGLPNVASNNETNNFTVALLRNLAADGKDVFDRAGRANFAAVARNYDRLAIHDHSARRIIEKLPLNFLYIGPILRAFPDASIIWLRRNPIDTCFAMYRTLFAAGYPFSYDFSDLARYYRACSGLMDHWARQYSRHILAVDYETLVAQPAAQGERIAAHCGLEWDPAALNITGNRSVSLTASASQVREPIYTRSAGVWRKYERHLKPLIAMLDTAETTPQH